MAWTTPKTDWGVDVVGSADFNRIEENTRLLGKGGGGQNATIPNVNAINSGSNYLYDIYTATEARASDVFFWNASNAVDHISHIRTTDRPIGNRITIINMCLPQNYLYIDVNTNIVADYAPIKTSDGYPTPRVAYASWTFLYTGEYWLLLDLYAPV